MARGLAPGIETGTPSSRTWRGPKTPSSTVGSVLTSPWLKRRFNARSRSGKAGGVCQARIVELPQPDPDLPHLADVVPSVLAAMGVAGFDGPIPLPDEITGACVLLIDGLGAELLDTYADDAPVLAGMRGPSLQVGFPSTTAAGIAAIGTGRRSGEHGMV